MGLAIEIGALAGALEGGDQVGAEAVRNEFARLNVVLRKRKLPIHVEREVLPEVPYRGQVEGFPYSCLHYLRRVCAYVRAGLPVTPAPDGRASEDPVLRSEYADRNKTSHLIHHSDADGYYLPIDCEHPMSGGWLSRIPGDTVGSSQRLLAELVEIAPHIGISLSDGKLSDGAADILAAEIEEGVEHDFATERMVWFTLFEAASSSVWLGTGIRFG